MSATIYTGDCREVLARLADCSVHTCVTSPPYFGLRDYGVDGQLGLEQTPEEFVTEMVAVFRDVRRVLRDDGTLWLNLGDSYASNKQLLGMPWRVAFALQADGWYLRQDIIWSKPNPMPESVRDRCTKSHEYLFLLSKSERYYFDRDAIAEASSWDPSKSKMPDGWDTGPGAHGSFHRDGREKGRKYSFARETKLTPGEHGQKPQHRPEREDVDYCGRRNKRSVWTVATRPFKEAHFATFPPALIEPCILAGCPAGGLVLDPFGGAGTTAVVAERLGRDSLLIELNPEYVVIANRRLGNVQPGLALERNASLQLSDAVSSDSMPKEAVEPA